MIRKNIDIEGNNNRKASDTIPTYTFIEWDYPEICDREKQSIIEIDLVHTRAADSIRIKYDARRDGWIIEQAAIFSWEPDDQECDQDWQEVAFIQAWAREKDNRLIDDINDKILNKEIK